MMDQSRIKVIDGLRTFAVLGVIWTHNWSFWFHQPKAEIFKIDIHRLLSVGGTGVNLFFVISGFCMYLMYGKRGETNISSFVNFIKNRYIRIAPACIVSVIVTGIWFSIVYDKNEWIYYLPFFATFTNPFFGYGGLYPHYWSLCTEWQFYLVLPLFFMIRKKHDFAKTLFAFMVFCLLFKLFIFSLRLPGFVEYTRHPLAEIMTTSILYRFIEFGYGILICHLFLNKISIPPFLKGISGFLIGFCILFLGRIMDTTEVILFVKGTGLDVFLRVISYPVLTGGYAIMLINMLYSDTLFSKITSSNWITYMGKISYSMYLWHWLFGKETAALVIQYAGSNGFTMWFAYILEILILIPVSKISYELFEKFYFSRIRNKPETSTIAVSAANKR